MKGYNIDDIIKKTVAETLKEYDYKKKQELRKNVFHNTELLLKNYNSLTEHYKNAVDSISFENVEENILEIVDDIECTDELFIKSIRRSKFRTLIMITHIDCSLKELKAEMIKKKLKEKYEVLDLLYLQEKGYDEIALRLHCSEMTARRWKNEMIQSLSIYLWGIDGAKIEL